MITVGLIRVKLSNLGCLYLLTYPSTVVLRVRHQVGGCQDRLGLGATGRGLSAEKRNVGTLEQWYGIARWAFVACHGSIEVQLIATGAAWKPEVSYVMDLLLVSDLRLSVIIGRCSGW